MIKKNGGIFGRNPTYNDVVVEGTLTMKEAQVFDNDITINGDLTVNGTETVINTVELNVDDKNITMGAVVAKVGLAATTNITAGQFTVQLSDTSGLIPGMTVTKTSGTGAFGASPKIASVDSHTQITLTVAHATSGTIIFDTGGATDDTADGGGITLKGTTDKFIKWVKASVAWVFSDPIKAPDVTVDNLTASQTVFTDTNKKLVTKSQTDAANAILPSQASATGKYLKSDGTNASWDQIDVGTSDITGTLPVANGGTGGTTQAEARTGLGLGSIATQAANSVAITGGAVDGVSIGGTTAATIANVDNLRLDGNTVSITQTNGDLALSANGSGLVKVTGSSVAVQTVSASITYPQSSSAGDTMPHLKFPTRNDGTTNTTQSGSSIQQIFADPNGGAIARIEFQRTAGTGGGNTSGSAIVFRTTKNTYSPYGAEYDTDRGRFDQLGNLRIENGNLVIGTSGKGIDFSATSDGSGTTTSELFDDYEKGTWTPVLISSGQSGNFTATTAGSYTKIGDTVIAAFDISWTALPSVGAEVYIQGLPFTYDASLAYGGGGCITTRSGIPVTNGNTMPLGTSTGGTRTGMRLRSDGNTVVNAVNGGNTLSASGSLKGFVVYKAG